MKFVWLLDCLKVAKSANFRKKKVEASLQKATLSADCSVFLRCVISFNPHGLRYFLGNIMGQSSPDLVHELFSFIN